MEGNAEKKQRINIATILFQVHKARPAQTTLPFLLETKNRYASLVGGGETECTSPPKKKRCRSRGPSIGRRPKTSRRTTNTTGKDRQDKQERNPKQENISSPSSSTKQSDKRSAWLDSPKGKESIAKSRKKYESSEKAHLTRKRYESNEGLETRRRYESNEGLETRRRYESNEGLETRRRYESNEGLETRRRYESNDGLETRRTYDSSLDGLERKRRYDTSQLGADRKAKYELSPGGAATRRRYKSAEGRLVRVAYTESDAGISARMKAAQKYKNSEAGRDVQTKSRRRYELKEAAKRRKLMYNKKKASNRLVKKAVLHSVTHAAERRVADTEGGQLSANDSERQEQFEQTKQAEPDVEESSVNKAAMASIRTHTVSFNWFFPFRRFKIMVTYQYKQLRQ